ncbi:lytic murein transglycosylase [Sphingomonas vulcanisoli]|uniref:Lytic murein transglycosylase n=1 Tax=Sphingomonas vulcanisoli TaxID=1658060 RepID=A0ABX0TRZ9_9SPHN|nr:lytic murein transglycosylase [Sphingomonas vulcanisoli]NIJ06975.1 lytic murein transglycosylase [Sphingomonas vulcanisoli]
MPSFAAFALALIAAQTPQLPYDLPASPAPTVATPPAPTIDSQQAAFTAFIAGLRPRAIAAGVNPATFDRETTGLTINPRVIRADRNQPGGPALGAPSGNLNFAPYRAQHFDAAHIAGGQRRYVTLRPLLSSIEQQTGVPEAMMLSLYGHETGYGSFSGNLDLLQSFATLAWDGRRRELFTVELIDTLKLIDRGIPRSTLKGSWAGATGYPQFLPSVYLRLAKDGDGDGKADIWRSEPDALASIANYLVDAGWKPNVVWGVAVQLPADFDRASIRSPLISPRCPRVHARLSRWQTFAEWKARGVIPLAFPGLRDDEQMTLIEPDGPGARAYLLSSNYQVILDYNCSNFYGLAAGLLADAITR